MSVEWTCEGSASVRVTGEVDLSNVEDLHSALQRVLIESPKGFMVDMTDLTYIDSAGIQSILSVYKKLRPAGGIMVLVIKSGAVKDIFDLLHLDVFPGIAILDSISSAKQLLSAE
ncbi:MAG TPA: STAS domain-containing protein [Armatimonadota bacterium]|jgi:anti-sigma B factor antagonist